MQAFPPTRIGAMISIPPTSNEEQLAQISTIEPQLELVIRRGLAESVHKTSAWVVTDVRFVERRSRCARTC